MKHGRHGTVPSLHDHDHDMTMNIVRSYYDHTMVCLVNLGLHGMLRQFLLAGI